MPTPRNYLMAAIAATIITAPAFVGSVDQSQSVSIKISGYDLSTQLGQQSF